MVRRSYLWLVLFFPLFHLTAWFSQSNPSSEKAQRAKALLDGFDETVMRGLEEFEIPAMSIGIIADGEVIYSKAFGERDREKHLPATSETLFPVGSCTKAFTSFSVGGLVEEGLIDWDQQIIDILPEFRLWDQYATQNLTVRDLLSHRSGLPRHDFMWYNSTFTREDIVSRLRYLEPACDIRERFNYNNLMYLVLGSAIERAAGMTWEEVVREKILKPLDMKQTGFSVKELKKTSNYALPYIGKGGEVIRLPLRDFSNIGPAGSIYSNIDDMCKWIQMQLDYGVIGEKSLLGYGTIKEMHAPQVVISGYPESKEARVSAYGLGWCVQTYRGTYNVSHDGGIDGYTSIASLLPQDGFGIVILCNKNLSALPRILVMHAFDKLLELPEIDWLQEGIDGLEKNKEALRDSQLSENYNRKPNTTPSHPFSDFEGVYVHPGYGEVAVRAQDHLLIANYNGIAYRLSHWHYDVFSVDSTSEDLIIPREGVKFSFSANVHGEIDSLSIPFETSAPDIVFKKQPHDRHESLAYLRQFVGTYQIYGYTVDVILRDHALYSIIPGQPLYELIPGGENEFSIKSHSGYTVRFVMDEEEMVKEVLLVQPYGVVFTAKPKKEHR